MIINLRHASGPLISDALLGENLDARPGPSVPPSDITNIIFRVPPRRLSPSTCATLPASSPRGRRAGPASQTLCPSTACAPASRFGLATSNFGIRSGATPPCGRSTLLSGVYPARSSGYGSRIIFSFFLFISLFLINLIPRPLCGKIAGRGDPATAGCSEMF